MATFTDLTINKPGSSYTLEATGGGLTSVTSTAFAVTNQLVLTTQPPSTVTAGSPFGLVAKVEDGLGNVISSFNGSVTVSNYYEGGTLGGTLTVNAVQGVATFTNLTLTQSMSYAYLQVAAAGVATTTTNDFTVAAASATQLSTPTFDTTPLTSAPLSLTVYAEDPNGNTDPTFDGSVSLALTNNPTGATLGGTLTATAVNGVATFPAVTINKPGSGYTLQASANGLTPGSLSAFAVMNQLVLTTPPPSTVTAGSPFGLAVTDEDGLGNVISSFDGSVTVSGYYGGGGALGGTLTVSAVNGVATFSGLTLTQAMPYAALQVAAAGLSGAYTNDFAVTNAAATKLVVVAQPPTVATAGAPFSLQVQADDRFGNIDANFSGNVSLAFASNPTGAALAGTLIATAVDGVATFSDVMINKPGSDYILQAAGGELADAETIAMNVTAAGVATHMAVISQPPSSVSAGGSFGIVVQAEDDFGAVDAAFDGSVTLALAPNSSATALGGTVTVTAVDGVATFSGLTLDTAGASTLSVTANGLVSTTTNSINVTADAATHWVFQAPVSNVLAGIPFSLTVYAEDAHGNVDPTFDGSIALALASGPSGAILGGPLTTTVEGGIAEFNNLTLDKLGVGYSVQAAGAGLTAGTTATFAVVNDQFVVTAEPPSSIAIGTAFGVTVTAENSANAVDTSFNGVVSVALVNLGNGAATLGGTLTATAVNGVATFTGLTVNQAGDYVLSLSANGAVPTSTSEIDVTAAQSLIVTAAEWPSTGLTLELGSDGNLHAYATGTTTPDVVPSSPPASLTNIEITSPGSTTTNLTIDSTGNPIPTGALDYSGAGGLIITGFGQVTLSQAHTYTGNTTVSSGTLIITKAFAIPATKLTVVAGATFIYDPASLGASTIIPDATITLPNATSAATSDDASATTVVPSSATPASSTPVLLASSALDVSASGGGATPGPASVSGPAGDSLFQSSASTATAPLGWPLPASQTSHLGQSVPARDWDMPAADKVVRSSVAKRFSAADLAWFGQVAVSSDSSDQQNKDAAMLALETVFAQYGQ